MVILPFGIMLSYSSHCLLVRVIFNFLFCFESVSCLGTSRNLSLGVKKLDRRSRDCVFVDMQ